MQRTLKKESKVLEIAERETIETSFSCSSRIQPTVFGLCVWVLNPYPQTKNFVGEFPVCLAGQHVFV